MFKWVPFPFLRFTLFLILGIVLYDEFELESYSTSLWILTLLLSLYVLFTLIRVARLVSGVTALMCIMALGYSLALLADESRHSAHYSLSWQEKVEGFEAKVIGDGLEKENYVRYAIELIRTVQDEQTVDRTGKLHLYLMRDDSMKMLTYGDVILVADGYSEIPAPQNPHEFNYKNYINRSQIYGQCFTNSGRVRVTTSNPDNSVMALAIKARKSASQTILEFVPNEREQSIIYALVLGIKDHLDDEIKTAYSSAGAMHVLAVSGLHVGIVYVILTFLFGWVRQMRNLKWLYAFLVLSAIWFFAFVTGLSPSVMRAATMFTVLALRDVQNTRSNIYNSIGLAAFVLLIFDPNFIYSVGFQLSFIAVFGIVFFHPRIYRWLNVPNIFLDKVWSITCISLAAQLSTFPLTIYYFHQFPTYFLLSNLAVIPAAMVLLSLSLPMLFLGNIVPVFGSSIGILISWITYGLNRIVISVEQLPFSLVSWLYMDRMEVLLIYIVIIFFFLAIQYRSYSATLTWIFTLFILSINAYLDKIESIHQQKLVVYEIRDKTAIDIIDGESARLLIDEYDTTELSLLGFQINPNRLATGLRPIDETIEVLKETNAVGRADPFDCLIWKGYRFLILDEDFNSVLLSDPIIADFVLVTDNAPVPLDLLTEKIKFDQLIISSDCSPWYAEKYNKTELPFRVHYISKDGHWMLNLDKMRGT